VHAAASEFLLTCCTLWRSTRLLRLQAGEAPGCSREALAVQKLAVQPCASRLWRSAISQLGQARQVTRRQRQLPGNNGGGVLQAIGGGKLATGGGSKRHRGPGIRTNEHGQRACVGWRHGLMMQLSGAHSWRMARLARAEGRCRYVWLE